MTPSQPNAFLTGIDRRSHPCRNLTSLLAPMRARVEATAAGFALELEPVTAHDALAWWAPGRAAPATEAVIWLAPDTARTETLASRLRRLEVPTRERFDADCAALPVGSLAGLLGQSAGEGLSIVLVDGPIDARDVRAIQSAAVTGSPLAGDLRAALGIRVLAERALRIDVREHEEAAMLVAQNFREYLAALTASPSSALVAPDVRLVDRLLDRSGHLRVRAIESEIYSTAIDVGVSTAPGGDLRPADTSLIYDRYGNTWHGE